MEPDLLNQIGPVLGIVGTVVSIIATIVKICGIGTPRCLAILFVCLGAAPCLGLCNPFNDHFRVDFEVYYEDSQSRPRRLDLQNDTQPVLYSGDGYRIHFKPHQDSYVYLYQIDAASVLTPLWPNPDFVSTVSPEVKAHTSYWIPDRAKWLELDDTRGYETIYLVATSQPRPDIESLFAHRAHHESGSQSSQLKEQTIVLQTMAPRRVRADRESVGTPASWLETIRQGPDELLYRLRFEHR